MAIGNFAYSQKSQDSLSIRLDSAEKQFLQKNLTLLASHYNLEVSRALIIQASLWNNPNFQFGQGVYNTASHKFFEFNGPNSIQSAQIQQLFLLAGKRNKQVKIAKTNAQIAEYAFFDLIRTLKAQLRTDFYSIYFLQQSAKVYDQEISSLGRIAKVYSEQVLKGNIAKKEEIRIRSQLFSLQNEYLALKIQILGFQSDLNLLLITINAKYYPVVDSTLVNQFDFKTISVDNLIDTAMTYRFDLKSSESSLLLSKQNLSLQKAIAIPDITMGLSYASNGSAAPNYFQVFAGFDLPFFNRNQGNIKANKFLVNQNEIQFNYQKQLVQNDVFKAYNNLLENQKVFKTFNPQFLKDYDLLIGEVLKNYSNKNLSLLEFLDFYDSYKQNILQANNLQLNRINTYQQINFVVGKDIL